MDKALSFLDLSKKRRSPTWTTVDVVFVGAENYALISVEAEVRIKFVPGGFETKFRNKFEVPSELLIGSCSREAKIYDIEIRISEELVMSMAKMYPKTFPRVVTSGDVVGING